MNTGMLWFDNDPKTSLKSKIIRAADYYRKKYGRVPNLCLVHPAALSGSGTGPSTFAGAKVESLGVLTVRGYRPVLPGHLWIGVEDKN